MTACSMKGVLHRKNFPINRPPRFTQWQKTIPTQSRWWGKKGELTLEMAKIIITFSSYGLLLSLLQDKSYITPVIICYWCDTHK